MAGAIPSPQPRRRGGRGGKGDRSIAVRHGDALATGLTVDEAAELMAKLRRYTQGQIEADGGSARAKKVSDDAPATTASSPLHAKAKLLMAANDAILLYATDELQNHFQGLWQVTSKLHGILDAEDKKNLKLPEQCSLTPAPWKLSLVR